MKFLFFLLLATPAFAFDPVAEGLESHWEDRAKIPYTIHEYHLTPWLSTVPTSDSYLANSTTVNRTEVRMTHNDSGQLKYKTSKGDKSLDLSEPRESFMDFWSLSRGDFLVDTEWRLMETDVRRYESGEYDVTHTHYYYFEVPTSWVGKTLTLDPTGGLPEKDFAREIYCDEATFNANVTGTNFADFLSPGLSNKSHKMTMEIQGMSPVQQDLFRQWLSKEEKPQGDETYLDLYLPKAAIPSPWADVQVDYLPINWWDMFSKDVKETLDQFLKNDNPVDPEALKAAGVTLDPVDLDGKLSLKDLEFYRLPYKAVNFKSIKSWTDPLLTIRDAQKIWEGMVEKDRYVTKTKTVTGEGFDGPIQFEVTEREKVAKKPPIKYVSGRGTTPGVWKYKGGVVVDYKALLAWPFAQKDTEGSFPSGLEVPRYFSKPVKTRPRYTSVFTYVSPKPFEGTKELETLAPYVLPQKDFTRFKGNYDWVSYKYPRTMLYYNTLGKTVKFNASQGTWSGFTHSKDEGFACDSIETRLNLAPFEPSLEGKLFKAFGL